MHLLLFFQWMDEDEIRQTMKQDFLDSLFIEEEEHKRMGQEEEQIRMDYFWKRRECTKSLNMKEQEKKQ